MRHNTRTRKIKETEITEGSIETKNSTMIRPSMCLGQCAHLQKCTGFFPNLPVLLDVQTANVLDMGRFYQPHHSCCETHVTVHANTFVPIDYRTEF